MDVAREHDFFTQTEPTNDNYSTQGTSELASI